MHIQLGDSLPALSLPATGHQQLDLADCLGKPLILYFYPKDNTPGCTQEGEEFRDSYAQFKELGAEILGVSRDSVKTHENFKAKYHFPFELLADQAESLCTLFDVIKPKTMFGKPVRGIQRSTFLFDRTGVLRREWRKVSVDGHVAEVLAALAAL
jgi:thioredoxin-dependent peroxiredoxin